MKVSRCWALLMQLRLLQPSIMALFQGRGVGPGLSVWFVRASASFRNVDNNITHGHNWSICFWLNIVFCRTERETDYEDSVRRKTLISIVKKGFSILVTWPLIILQVMGKESLMKFWENKLMAIRRFSQEWEAAWEWAKRCTKSNK